MLRRCLRAFNTRAFISLLLALLFGLMLVSGIVLYVAPQGRVAHWTNWTISRLSKDQWSAIHVNAALLLIIVSALHVWLNWRLLWGYVKNKAASGLRLRSELPAALLVAVVLVTGTLLDVTPFSLLITLSDQAKDHWAHSAPRAPVPHSEELTLAEFAGHVNVLPEEAVEALRKQGFVVEDSRITLGELARQKGVAPSEVYQDIVKHFPAAGMGPHQGRGLGIGREGGQGQGRGLGQGQGAGAGLGRNRQPGVRGLADTE